MNIWQTQPSYKIYAFDRGWRIMKYVTENLFKRTDVEARGWFNKAGNMKRDAQYKDWFKKYWMYVVVMGLGLAGVAQYVSAMILAALFLAIQAIVLSIWVVISMVGMGLLLVYTFLFSRIYGIFYRCPYCHKDIPIPTFICPKCHAEHTQLWPSIYGVLAHRCTGCGTRLPTLSLLGRNKLDRICPNTVCRRPLYGGGTNIHIPIVGGPSTGKTNYIVTATRDFKQNYECLHNYKVEFADPVQKRDFELNLQRLNQGRELVKTVDIVPQAYSLQIKAPRSLAPSSWVSKLAYIYDAAGEAFITNENTSRQEYYKYIDGILFVIDPCAIPTFCRIHQGDIDLIREALRPSILGVMQTYERMIQMFEASVGVQKCYNQPIAIAVTKVDALGLENEIGLPAAQQLMARDLSITSEADAISMVVRDFLSSYGLDNFIRDVESQFTNVKYFSCSALGRLPIANDTRGFTPIRALDPLVWLLAKTKAIKQFQRGKQTVQPQPMPMQQSI